MRKNKTMNKTHKATAKRFKLTKKGKLMHGTQGDNSHLKVNKNRHQKSRKNGENGLINKAEVKKLTGLMHQ